jgi:hypothetical protein
MPKIDKTEEFLKRLSFRPPPPGLRKKVLLAAAKKRADQRLWSPLRWKAALALLALGFAAVLADIALSRVQVRRLTGLLGGPSLGHQTENSRQEFMAEVLGGLAETAWLDWRMKIEEKTGAEIHREAFWYLKEEFDGS